MNVSNNCLEGIGGWLVLVALGVISSPLIQAASLIQLSQGLRDIWPDGAPSPVLTSVLIAEIFTAGVLVTWACINVYLMFTKKRIFPASFVGLLIVGWLAVVADLYAADLVADLKVTIEEIGKSAGQLFWVVVWSMYMFRSTRVRNTFVYGPEDRKVWRSVAVASAISGAVCVSGALVFASQFPPDITEQTLISEAISTNDSIGGQMIDEGVRFDRAEADGMTFSYYYTLTDGAAIEWDVNELVQYFRPPALDSSCNDLGSWLKSGVTVKHLYFGTDELPVASFQFTAKDCPDLAAGSNDPAQFTARDIAANAKASFVTVRGQADGSDVSTGSGFIVRQTGVVVTSLHVLQGVDSASVELPGGEVYRQVFVLAADEERDLAILQIPATGLPSLRIADDRAVEVGDKIFVLGNPLGFEQTFTDGLLSARRVSEGIEYLQISAPISQGSSGGPVLNGAGEVIGVATAYMSEGQNLNIAMPSHYVSGMLAVSGDPEPFEELAGVGAFYAPQTAASRNSEAAELMQLLPADLRERVEKLEPYKQQTIVRGFQLGSILEEAGWSAVETDSGFDLLGADAYNSFNLTLEAGVYSAIGVCDDDCTDLDLGVQVQGQGPLTDRELDAEPAISFTVSEASDVAVMVAMHSCATDKCLYWVRLYRQ